MSAIEPLYKLISPFNVRLSREHTFIIEIDLFTHLCDELKKFFKKQFKDYLNILKLSPKKEEELMETNLLRYIINDIIDSENYSLAGLACEIQIPDDVLYEIALGRNNNPSALLLRKLVEIHRLIRPTLYKEIMQRIVSTYKEF